MSSEQVKPISVEVSAYSGRGISVDTGSTVRVTNLHGTQIGDMFCRASFQLDTARTRLLNRRLFPEVG
jgi:uncharacterized protein YcgI (DUF1989 family)